MLNFYVMWLTVVAIVIAFTLLHILLAVYCMSPLL